MSTLLANASSSFKSEVESKQNLIDQKHAKLRETSSQLASDRRRLTILHRQIVDRNGRARRIGSLRAANEEQRVHLSGIANVISSTDSNLGQDIKIGGADAEFEIDAEVVPLSHEARPPREFSPALRSYLTTLPPTAILEARLAAYERNNAHLSSHQKTLETRSIELESKLERILEKLHRCQEGQEESLEHVIGRVSKGMKGKREIEGRENVGVSRLSKILRRGKDQG